MKLIIYSMAAFGATILGVGIAGLLGLWFNGSYKRDQETR